MTTLTRISRGELQIVKRDEFEDEVKISGSGKVSGGKYEKISITGSGRVEGDVEAKEIIAAGSARFEGNVKADKITVTGSCEVSGSVKSEVVISRGSLSVDKFIETNELKSYGRLKVGEKVLAVDVYFAGNSEVEKDVESESFVSRGSFVISGLLTADEIDIWLGSDNSAGEVGGSKIEIRKKGNSLTDNPEKIKGGVEKLEKGLDKVGEKLGFDFEINEESISRGIEYFGEKISDVIQGFGKGEFESTLIEGDNLFLEGVKADTVRGSVVRIGEDCVIDKVEYSDTIRIAENSMVKEQVEL